ASTPVIFRNAIPAPQTMRRWRTRQVRQKAGASNRATHREIAQNIDALISPSTVRRRKKQSDSRYEQSSGGMIRPPGGNVERANIHAPWDITPKSGVTLDSEWIHGASWPGCQT
ncbi:MAG: hypothetical protein K8R59_06445, partial [Thermoanaerobaculales bacterium]|nr:hypothetical protein [Thermoanaerobaculales bacterium]